LIPQIPTRGQLADEAFEKFATTEESDATHSRELRTLFIAFLLDPQSRFLVENGRFAELRSRDPNLFESLQRLAPSEREKVVNYLRSNISLSDFERAA
jgi:hypothetical protein